MTTDKAFVRALNIWNKPDGKIKLFYPVTIKDGQGNVLREITEIDAPKPKKRGTPFNQEDY